MTGQAADAAPGTHTGHPGPLTQGCLLSCLEGLLPQGVYLRLAYYHGCGMVPPPRTLADVHRMYLSGDLHRDSNGLGPARISEIEPLLAQAGFDLVQDCSAQPAALPLTVTAASTSAASGTSGGSAARMTAVSTSSLPTRTATRWLCSASAASAR